MGTHIYYDAGPRKTNTRTSIDGVVRVPVSTEIELHDGADHVQLAYTDLDALDETCRLFLEARANHVAALCEGRSELVDPAMLNPDDLAVIDGQLVCVDNVVITGDEVIVRYGKMYDGTYDMTAGHAITLSRRQRVQRLNAGVRLAAV